jgi:MoxR-like ATPase
MPINSSIHEINKIILGKEKAIKLAVCCLLAKGHLLIEDMPGVGKTTLALTLSKVFGLDYNRLQFTSDLLPADITGISVYNTQSHQFEFHPGPLFNQVLLADEINRATPKTQSALLEAMEENKVSVDGKTYKLPEPFFVIATQNPVSQHGTFPLPESQLDRFLMRIHIGYPDRKAEKSLLSGRDPRSLLEEIKCTVNPELLEQYQRKIQEVHVSDAIIEYILTIADKTRNEHYFAEGLSPRAGLSLKRAAQAWAFIEMRDYVMPEDIQNVFYAVCQHRLHCAAEFSSQSVEQLLNDLIKSIQI